MSVKNLTVYTSDGCNYCEQVIELLDQWNIRYVIKNVSKHKPYMEELQEQGIYGTPVTYVHHKDQFILGVQVEELKKAIR